MPKLNNCLTCAYGPAGDPFLLPKEMTFDCRNEEAFLRIPACVTVHVSRIYKAGNILTTVNPGTGGLSAVITHCPAWADKKA